MYYKNPPTNDICIKWNNNRFINPITNRTIKKNGTPYKFFLKHYLLYSNNLNNNIDLIDNNDNKLDKNNLNDNNKLDNKLDKKSKDKALETKDIFIDNYLNNKLFVKTQTINKKYKWNNKECVFKFKITYKNKTENIKGRENKYYSNMDTYNSIHEHKFIMLKNQNCYDIEVLLNHIISSYDNKIPCSDPGNIDPENSDKIWNNITDLKRIIAHRLIHNPNIIKKDQWLY